MSPLNFISRLGHISADLIPNNALFITEDKSNHTSDYDVKPVPYVDYTENTDYKILDITLHDNLRDVSVKIERETKGYKSAKLQAYYFLYSPNRKDKKLKRFLNSFGQSTLKINSIENIAPEDAFVKPLKLKAEYTHFNAHLFDYADDKIIFKLGNIFGDYIEIDEISERISDYVFQYAFHTKKTIVFHFPSQLKVSELVNIPEFEKLTDIDGVDISSQLTINGNTITYVKDEKYKKQRISKNEKENMIEIFQFYNDLADMNIVLEKK